MPGILQARILVWVVISFSSNLPDPGTELESPVLLAVSVSLSHLGSPMDALEVVTQLSASPLQRGALLPLTSSVNHSDL